MPVKIFFCYAREDEPLLNKLKSHLRPLQREGLIEVWYDRDISAGTEWEAEIKQHLNTAQIVLLLVSPDFMDSDYCYGIEMKRALERRAKGEAEVIPVILRHVYWHGEPLGKLQALPKDGKPVTDPDLYNLDRAFYDVATGIRVVVEKLNAHIAAPWPVITREMLPEAARPNSSASVVQQVYKVTPAIAPFPVEKLRLLRTLTGHKDAVESVAISLDGRMLVSGSWDNMIKVWNLLTGKEARTLVGHTGSIRSVAISPDGQTLVSASNDSTIKIWNLFTGKELRTLTNHTHIVWCVAISPDGQMLVSGDHVNTIKVWNLSTGQELHTLIGHVRSVLSVAIGPDGQTLVSGSEDNTIKVWNLITGKEIRSLVGHTGSIRSIAMSPDGQIFVSASDDKTIKIWNLITGKDMRTLTDYASFVSSVAMSPDGQTLVSGSSDKTIKVWGV